MPRDPGDPADDPDAERGERAGRRDDRTRREDENRGLRFWLPPLRLPALRLPREFHLVLPAPGHRSRAVRGRTVLALAVAFDVIDALLALGVGVDPPSWLPWVRGGAGLLLAVAATGALGVVYAWEPAAAAVGLGALTVAPTLTVLVLVALLR